MSVVLLFMEGKGPDHRGRYLHDILAWDINQLRLVTDYIQWLFPLNESSSFSRLAPEINLEDVALIKASAAAIRHIKISEKRMHSVFGLRLAPQNILLWDSAQHGEKIAWAVPGNPIYLRFSRIMKALKLLGLHDEALLWYNFLQTTYHTQPEDPFGPVTISVWQSIFPDIKFDLNGEN